MTIKSNPKRISVDTDRHLCKYLISPYRHSGIKAYKSKNNVSFPEDRIKVSSRLEYLKKIYHTKFNDFTNLCNSYGIESYTSNSDSIVTSPVVVPARILSDSPKNLKERKIILPKMNVKGNDMRQHQNFLNLEHPHLNKHGMLWFRDDDVELDGSLCSVLSIYQPLFDARDCDSVKLFLDENDPELLHHTHLNVPTFMIKDFKLMHKLDKMTDPHNPELYSFTAKKHSKCAIKCQSSDDHRLQRDEYRLPFGLKLEKFSNIENSASEIKKHYRTIEVTVTNKIKHKCSYVFWKILIDEETTNLSFGDEDDDGPNYHDEAEERMSKAFAQMNVG